MQGTVRGATGGESPEGGTALHGGVLSPGYTPLGGNGRCGHCGAWPLGADEPRICPPLFGGYLGGDVHCVAWVGELSW